MLLSAIPSIISLFFYLLLFILLNIFGKKSRVKSTFLLFLFIGMIRHFSSIGMHLLLPPGLIFWNRVTAIALITMGLLILIFSEVFTSHRIKPYERTLIIILYFFSVILILSGSIQTNLRNVEGLIHYDVTPFIYFVGLSTLYYSIRGLSIFVSSYLKEMYKTFKRRLILIIIGFSIYIFSGTTNMIPSLGKYPIDLIGSVVGTFIISIAFLKYRFLIGRESKLFNIKRFINFVITSLIFSIIFYFLIRFIFGIDDLRIIPLIIVFSIAYAYFDRWFYKLSSKLERELDSVKNEILKLSLSNPDIKNVEDCLKEFFSKRSNIPVVKIFYLSLGESFFIGTDYITKISEKNPFIIFLFKNNAPMYIEDFELEKEKYLMSPREKREIYETGCNFFIPLNFKDTKIGILAFYDEKRILENYKFKIIEIGNMVSSYLMNYINFKNIRNLYFRTILILVDALEARDRYTAGHSKRVAEMSKIIAETMGIVGEKLEYIEKAALLHDIGKIAIPDEILNKNEKLTDEEYEIIKKHPIKSAEIIRYLPDKDKIHDIILYHHERWDGKGYPFGLKKKEIPLGSRIIAVADAFDAMLSMRPYRENLTFDEAVKEIESESGKQFDPEVVKAFLKRIEDIKRIFKKYNLRIKENI